jgi:putative restriction endonuclease
VTPEYRVEVSKRLKTDFENCRGYYALHGREIALPEKVTDHPSKDSLAWHNEKCFVG